MKNKNISLKDALIQAGGTVDEGQEKFLTAVDSVLNKMQEDNESTYAEKLRTAVAEAMKVDETEDGKTITVAEKLLEVAERLEKMEKRTERKLTDAQKFQLRKIIKDNHKNIVDTIKSGQELEFEFYEQKAAAAFTTTNAVANDTGVTYPIVENFLVEDGVVALRYPENFILNYIPNRQVSKVPKYDLLLEQATEEGAVTVVAEGGTKPLVSDTFLRTQTARQKWAARIEWTEEFEMDNEKLFNEILRLFEAKVIRAWNNGMIATIEANATAYTTSVLDGTFVVADNGLAVIAAQSVIQGMNYIPDIVFMNPADIVTAMFTQDVDGNPRLLPYMQDGKINGLNVVASNVIDQGTAIIGDSSTYQEWHSGFILRFGTYANQFITNQKTAVGEVFSLLRIAQNDLAAWMVLDLEAVRESLTIETP